MGGHHDHHLLMPSAHLPIIEKSYSTPFPFMNLSGTANVGFGIGASPLGMN
jgi:hypothetical protein